MARTRYKKKVKNGNTYYFFRFTHKNLRRPRDLYGKTVSELDAKIEKLKNEMDHNVHVSKVKFGDYLKVWLETVHCINKKKGTIGGYQSTYRNHIVGSILYDIPISDLNSLDVQDYLNDLLRHGQSYNVVCSIRNLVSPCIRYAFQQQKIMVDFSRSLTVHKPTDIDNGTNVTPLTMDEQRQFIAVITGTTFEPHFQVSMNTGARIGELLALTWSDIDLAHREIRITKSMECQKNADTKKYECGIVPPKTKASNRTIPFPEFLVPYFQQLRSKELKKKMRLQNKYADLELVFANRLGYYLQTSTIRVALNKLQDQAGLRHFRIHDLRHPYVNLKLKILYNYKRHSIKFSESVFCSFFILYP